jgi:lysozyme family protein
MSARDILVGRVLTREGGVSQVAGESWVTRWGQTPPWLESFGLPSPVTIDEARRNYNTWLKTTRLDRLIGPTPDVLADVVIDYAVHSGHTTAIKALQDAVDVPADGVIGPVTLEAIAIDSDRRRAAAHIIAARSEHQGRLIARKPQQFAIYALGWARRQAEFIRELA